MERIPEPKDKNNNKPAITPSKREEQIQFYKEGKFDCPVCYLLMIEPIKQPCSHYFCLNCHNECMNFNKKCPLCRSEIPPTFEPKICLDFQAMAKINSTTLLDLYKLDNKQTYDQGMVKLKQAGEKLKIKFQIGNTYYKIRDPEPSEQCPGALNEHSWTFLVQLEGNKLDTHEFIDKVNFKFLWGKESQYQVKRYPFSVSKYGWGYFDIETTIHYKPWTNLQPRIKTVTQYFGGHGKLHDFTEEIHQSCFNNKKLLYERILNNSGVKNQRQSVAVAGQTPVTSTNRRPTQIDTQTRRWNI